MDGGFMTQTAPATGTLSTFEWPARGSTRLFSNGFAAVALFSTIGLAVALYLSFASPCSGVDLNAGCVPVELTAPAAQ